MGNAASPAGRQVSRPRGASGVARENPRSSADTEISPGIVRSDSAAEIVLPAVLIESTNPDALKFGGVIGQLHCSVGARCVFRGMRTSIVERLVWDGRRFEVYTKNSSYVFEIC